MGAYLTKPLKSLAKRAMTSSIVYEVLRARALRRRPVTVLVYHTLGPDTDDFDAWTVAQAGMFRRQMTALREHYDIVSLDEALHGAPSPRGKPRAVVTFDDGDAGLHAHLLPVLDDAKLPVTVYVATGQIESGQCYWFDRVMNALQSRRPLAIDLEDRGLGRWVFNAVRGERNWLQISGLLEKLKHMEPAARTRAMDAILAQSKDAECPRFTPLAPLTIAQLQDLARSPWVTIGAHTHCHSLLDRIPLGQAIDSITTSRRLLQAWTGQAVHHFAYPNGNHTPALEGAVADARFNTATTVESGLWGAGTRPFAIPRVSIGRYDDLDRFKLRLIGI